MTLLNVDMNKAYRHKRTGVVYRVIAPVNYTTQMKLGTGPWQQAVIYERKENPNGTFVRDLEKFKENFEEVT